MLSNNGECKQFKLSDIERLSASIIIQYKHTNKNESIYYKIQHTRNTSTG